MPKLLAEQTLQFQRHGTTGWKLKYVGTLGALMF
jgi:hypothetical protein